MLIFVLSLWGIVMGLLTCLVGLPVPYEPIIWVVYYVLAGVVLVRKRQPYPFRSGLFTSILAGFWVACVQSLLYRSYMANNPWYAEMFPKRAEDLVRVFYVHGAGFGLFFGLLLGGAVWAVDWFRRRRASQADEVRAQ